MFIADTDDPDCPVRIMYTGVTTGDVHYSELDEHNRWSLRPVRPLAVIRCTEHSDYSGGPVERSNYRVILGTPTGRRPGIVQIYGSHGHRALAYDATLGPVPDDDVLGAWLGEVANYPVIDESDLDELETELETEAWEDHGRRDFSAALLPILDALDPGHEHETPDPDPEILDKLWSLGVVDFNINGGSGFVIETGCLVHFYIQEWCDKVSSGSSRRAGPLPIYDELVRVAEACRDCQP